MDANKRVQSPTIHSFTSQIQHLPSIDLDSQLPVFHYLKSDVHLSTHRFFYIFFY
jgi:hypothetical protein